MATRYLISFLGDSNVYEDSIYSRADNSSSIAEPTKFVQIAAMHLYTIQQAYVVCPTAVAYNTFKIMMATKPPNTILSAGYGATIAGATLDVYATSLDVYATSLYTLIESIVSDPQNKNVEWIFDISLGFRSLPFEAASIIAYLAVVQPDVRVVDTIYAQQISPHGAKPRLFKFQSLTQQTTYNAWTRATDMFIRYGQADLLSEQLNILKQEQSNIDSLIAELNTNITGVADALHTANTRLLGECAANLQKNIGDMKQQAPDSGPLFTLLDRVAGEYAVFIPADDLYRAEIVRQRQVIKWYLDKRNWALAIQLAAEHLILLKQIADNNTNVSIPYHTRNLKQKVWYGWIFTDEHKRFIDFESQYKKYEKLIDDVYKAWYMRPFKVFDDDHITIVYWQQYIDGTLDKDQQNAIYALLNKVGIHDELIRKDFHVLQSDIRKSRTKHINGMPKLDVDSYRDIMTAIANGGNTNYEDILRELSQHSQYRSLANDCAILNGATPIGAQIREARNGMAHIDGGTSVEAITKMCECVCAISEKLYPKSATLLS